MEVERILSASASGVIYTATVKEAERLHGVLKVRHSIGLYHGKMSPADRKATQNAFMGDELRTVIATNAFGLGIDKRDLRFVLHYHFPGSVEAYYQEASRDGEPATCTMLYRVEDSRVQSVGTIAEPTDVSEPQRGPHGLRGATRGGPRQASRDRRLLPECAMPHRFLLEYFGESVPAEWVCGNCDACDAQQEFSRRVVRADNALAGQ